jgi:urease accessory protein
MMHPLTLTRLLQLASPALPVGAYSYSQGLEAAIEAGVVRDEATTLQWIGDVLDLTVSRMEAPLFLRLHAAWIADDGRSVSVRPERGAAPQSKGERRVHASTGSARTAVYGPVRPERGTATQSKGERRVHASTGSARTAVYRPVRPERGAAPQSKDERRVHASTGSARTAVYGSVRPERGTATQSKGERGAAIEWNDIFLASRESAELRAETAQMGYSLVRLLTELREPHPFEAWTEVSMPAAYTWWAVRCRIEAPSALVAYLWSWAENQVMAALKAVPLGQSAGQRVLFALGSCIADHAARAQTLDDDALGGLAPAFAILSSRHETQYSRLFRS